MKFRNCSITVCILARDCQQALVANRPLVEQLCQSALDYRVVVVENDSCDNTKQILSNWATIDQKVTILTLDHQAEASTGSRCKSRIARMAGYRNAYLSQVESSEFATDIIIMIDIDAHWIDVEGIISAIDNAPSDWGALFANGNRYLRNNFAPFFYDLYAFVPEGGSFDRSLADMRRNGRKIQRSLKKSAYIKCQSAFGGIGIYRYDSVVGNRYSVVENGGRQGEVLCEHIPFNNQVRGGCYVAKDAHFDYGRRTVRGFLWQTFAPDCLFERKPKFI